MIWNDDYLKYCLDEGERSVSADVPLIITRFTLALIQGEAVYSLPDKLIGIHRITYKGWEVNPLEHTDMLTTRLRPYSMGVWGRPKQYLRVGYGLNTIKLFPCPAEDVPADDANAWTTAVETACVVTAIRLADPDNPDYRLPDFVRRRTLKYFALNRAYLKEGPGQNVQAAEYFDQKFKMQMDNLKKIAGRIPRAVQLQFGENPSREWKRPPRPVLPSHGPWSF